MPPKISEPTNVEQRAWRRNQLLEVALGLALETGSYEISMTELARRAGLSRTSVYDYFSSSSEVIAQVLLHELDRYQEVLQIAIDQHVEEEKKLRAWIEASLTYISSGDHLLARGINSISTNPKSASVFRAKHKALLEPLIEVFMTLGVKSIDRALVHTQSVLDTAVKNIEILDSSGPDFTQAVNREITIATNLVLASLDTFRHLELSISSLQESGFPTRL